jgi:hypothetical protein
MQVSMRLHLLALLSAAATILVVVAPAFATPDPLTTARDATAAFNDQGSAQAAGYSLFTDKDDVACIDQPGQGAMGVHYVNGAFVQAGTIDAARPQAVVYEVQGRGVRLVALEYVVLKAGWDATHSGPPELFGQTFMTTPDGNRFGLPAFYSLHAWIWKANPSGLFNMWNPDVSCPTFRAPGGHSAMEEAMAAHSVVPSADASDEVVPTD